MGWKGGRGGRISSPPSQQSSKHCVHSSNAVAGELPDLVRQDLAAICSPYLAYAVKRVSLQTDRHGKTHGRCRDSLDPKKWRGLPVLLITADARHEALQNWLRYASWRYSKA